MNDFERYLTHALDDVEDSMVKNAMNYSLLAGGKRIRPQLLFSALRAYGYKETDGYRAASAIEMIHTYSLIHDDLPAMDDDTLRRGKPTCHVKFDEATAILAGDALLTHAFYYGATACDDANVNMNIVKALSLYSGANGMVLGQIKDLEGELKADISVSQLQDIHFYKTGKLLALPLVIAAYLTHHDEDIDTWNAIGHYIGLSFQIQDDILDEVSTVEELGKNIHSDAQNNKHTYVSIMGIDEAKKEADLYYQKAKDLLATLSIAANEMAPIFQLLITRKH